MEQFTTSLQKVLTRLKEEFFDFKNIEIDDVILTYFEYPYLTDYVYGISFYNYNGELKCLFRYWNIQYDLKRFQLGIYNIDRLAIKEERHQQQRRRRHFCQAGRCCFC